MNKKVLILFISVVSFALSSFAQVCTPNTALTTPGYYPDSAQGLPPAIATIPYSTVMQVRVKPDTTVPTFGTVTINYVQMDSIRGLPSGFTSATNPANGQFPGGGNGCILLSGNPVPSQVTGGPASNGVYPLIVYYHANVHIPAVGNQNVSGTNKQYHVTVLPASAGIVELENGQFNVFQNSPNPSMGHTDISYWMQSTDQVEFKVYNLLGNLVSVRQIRSEKGNNKISYDTSSLSPGIYLYSIRTGDKSISRRMIVSTH